MRTCLELASVDSFIPFHLSSDGHEVPPHGLAGASGGENDEGGSSLGVATCPRTRPIPKVFPIENMSPAAPLISEAASLNEPFIALSYASNCFECTGELYT